MSAAVAIEKTPVLLQKVIHVEMNWWAIQCAEREPFNQLVRKLPGRRWSATWNAWLVPLENYLFAELETYFPDRYELTLSPEPFAKSERKPNTYVSKPVQPKPVKISVANLRELALFHQELVLKGYSPSTLRTYESEFSHFLQTIKGVSARDFTVERLKDYFFYCHTTLKLSEATLHSKINALKFYYEQVLKRESFFWEVPRPKKKMQLPKVISEEKIVAGIEKLENLKHKALIMLAYSAGLRVSETVNLKIADIQSDRMQILIRQSKGKKDRMVPLSKALLNILRKYYLLYKPKEWLFEGQVPNMPISDRTAQAVFNQVYKQLGLPKGISFHSLRHSFATHLVENGIDVTFVQQLLGHNDVRTTLRYMHVSQKKINQIESPLDRALRKMEEQKNGDEKTN